MKKIMHWLALRGWLGTRRQLRAMAVELDSLISLLEGRFADAASEQFAERLTSRIEDTMRNQC